MEENLWWKTTFDGRQPLIEDDFQWKTTFDERWPLMEDDLWWKTTFDGRQPLMEVDLWWKTAFDGRQPLMEDDLQWKITFEGTQLFMEDMLWRKITCKLREHSCKNQNKQSNKIIWIKDGRNPLKIKFEYVKYELSISQNIFAHFLVHLMYSFVTVWSAIYFPGMSLFPRKLKEMHPFEEVELSVFQK